MPDATGFSKRDDRRHDHQQWHGAERDEPENPMAGLVSASRVDAVLGERSRVERDIDEQEDCARSLPKRRASPPRALAKRRPARLRVRLAPAGCASETSGVSSPETQYTRSGDVAIAYQVLGAGPPDVLFVPPFVNHELVRCDGPILGL
jgi:hypothetical protein